MIIYHIAKLREHSSMDIKEIRLENLLSILAEPDVTQASLASACESAPSVISQLKTGHRGMGSELARRIEKARNLPYGWMDTRHTYNYGETKNHHVASSAGTYTPLILPNSESESDFVQVPVYDAQLAAGNGARVDLDRIVERLPISRKYLVNSGIPESRATIAKVKGDSMEPTLNDGDVVLINAGINTPVSDRVFAFDFDGDLKVKRFIKRLDGSWRIVSDNEDKNLYADETLSNHNISKLRIIGQVVKIIERNI